MPECPNCGAEFKDEDQYMCESCGAELPTKSEKETQTGEEPVEREAEIAEAEEAEAVLAEAAMPDEQAVPEHIVPPDEDERPRPQRPPVERKDSWDLLGERWNEMTVGAQVALIGSVAGLIGFIVFLFALTRVGQPANISLYTILLPFAVSMYLLISSSDAPLRARILTYSAVALLGGVWFMPILMFPSAGLWWSLWLLGLIGMIGGGFMALWDATRGLEE